MEMADNLDWIDSVSMMFDSCMKKEMSEIVVDGRNFRLFAINSNPGALISGHYVWPASVMVSTLLSQQWSMFDAQSILELGSGCGLAGIVAASLTGCASVTMTDHDRGTLDIIRQNISINQNLICAKCDVEQLEWFCTEQKSAPLPLSKVDLVLGCDVVYCVEVVFPLFFTAFTFAGKFLLGRSFPLAVEIMNEIHRSCDVLGIEESHSWDNQGCVIQLFQLKSL